MKDCIDRDEVITLISRALHDILQLPKEQPEPYLRDQRDGDLISKQTVLDILSRWEKVPGYSEGELNIIRAIKYEVENMQSEQPEKLTDNEQRIFLWEDEPYSIEEMLTWEVEDE